MSWLGASVSTLGASRDLQFSIRFVFWQITDVHLYPVAVLSWLGEG